MHPKLAYFIDRDFDNSIAEEGLQGIIYETPCYSIENFYTSINSFKSLLKEEFGLQESDADFEQCLNLYKDRQAEFHSAVETLNAWIACQREISSDIKLSKIKISKDIKITLSSVMNTYTHEDLERKFPEAPPISPDQLQEKKQTLNSKNPQCSFRGKFEIEFLRKFITQLVEDANKITPQYFHEKRSVQLSIPGSEIIPRLSQHADTPDCLRAYLLQFKVER
ncbi:DUF4435 domain-containing protein [Spirulina sp.]|uniref:DUF4435 domain-containing protein n=1 Tax=Spirulina sp. TaxID=1157 RepID=UPI003F6F9766